MSAIAERLRGARTAADLLDALAALARQDASPSPGGAAAFHSALRRLRRAAIAPWSEAQGRFPDIPEAARRELAALGVDLRTRHGEGGEIRSTLESALPAGGSIYDYAGLGLFAPGREDLERALSALEDGSASRASVEARDRLDAGALARLLDRQVSVLFATRRSLLERNRIPNALATRLAVLPANDYDTARSRVMPVVRQALCGKPLGGSLRDLLAPELGALLARLAQDHHHAVKPETDRLFGAVLTFGEVTAALHRFLDDLGQSEGPGAPSLYRTTVQSWEEEVDELALRMGRLHEAWRARAGAEARSVASDPAVRTLPGSAEDVVALVRHLFPRLYPGVPRLVDLRKPLIVLVGGATGTGKSSVARILSDHLGVHAYFSADVLRQVQRAVTRPDTHPALHRSSFAGEPLLPGFMEQSVRIAEAVEAVIRRLASQGVSAVIEGVSLIPGFLSEDVYERANIKHLVVAVGDEDDHAARFRSRGREASSRGEGRYVSRLPAIREIQGAYGSLAEEAGVRVLENVDLVATASMAEAWMESPFTDRWRVASHPDLAAARAVIARRDEGAAAGPLGSLSCHLPEDILAADLSPSEQAALAVLGRGSLRRLTWAYLEDLSKAHRSFLDVRDLIFDWTRQLSLMAFSTYDEARRRLQDVLAREPVAVDDLEALFLPRYRRTLTAYLERDGAADAASVAALGKVEDLEGLGRWIEGAGLAPALVRRYAYWLAKRRETVTAEVRRLEALRAEHDRLAAIETGLFRSDPLLKPQLGSVDLDAVIRLCRRLLADVRPSTPGAKDLARPTLVLLGGAPATSKKTVGRAVKQALAIPTYLRTDVIRQVMRHHLDPAGWPHLHASSLALPPEGERDVHVEYLSLFDQPRDLIAFKDRWRHKVLDRFFRNAGATFLGVQSVMDRLIQENQSAVIEGPAVLPGALPARYFREANVVQVVLLSPDEHEHYRRYIDQGHSREGFLSIRFVHNELRAMARDAGVLLVPGQPAGAAVSQVVRRVTGGLCDRPFTLTHPLLCHVLESLGNE